MAILHSNIKIRITQIISIIAFGIVLAAKYNPNSDYTNTIKPFSLYIAIAFFVAQGFMIYLVIKENKAKKINSN